MCHSVAGYEYLDVGWNRLRSQGLRREKPVLIQRVLQPDLARSDQALESFPGTCPGGEVGERQNEVAAVGAMGGARLKHGVVTDISAHVRAPIDPAKEVRPAWVRL